MSATIKTTLGENFLCSTTHLPSGSTAKTDAANGTSFSPPELVASALASCMLSMLHLTSTARGLNLTGTTAEASVNMVDHTILSIDIFITVPNFVEESIRPILEKATDHCPVHKALDPGVNISTHWSWK